MTREAFVCSADTTQEAFLRDMLALVSVHEYVFERHLTRA